MLLNAFISLFCIAGLAILYMKWKDLIQSIYRDNLFEIRHKLFFYAKDNDLFEHPAFLFLWRELNGQIRYAHDIFALLFTVQLQKKALNPKIENMKKERDLAFSKLNENDMAFFKGLENEVMNQFVRFFLLQSPVITIFFLVATSLTFLLLNLKFLFIGKKGTKRFDDIQKDKFGDAYDKFNSGIPATT